MLSRKNIEIGSHLSELNKADSNEGGKSESGQN